MLTLFIHFLLNMETLAWLTPLRVYRHSCMRTPCAHVCGGSAAHTLGAPRLRRTLATLQSLASFQDIKNPLKNCYLHWIPRCSSLPSRQVRLLRSLCGNSWGWLGGPGIWNGGWRGRGGLRWPQPHPRP